MHDGSEAVRRRSPESRRRSKDVVGTSEFENLVSYAEVAQLIELVPAAKAVRVLM